MEPIDALKLSKERHEAFARLVQPVIDATIAKFKDRDEVSRDEVKAECQSWLETFDEDTRKTLIKFGAYTIFANKFGHAWVENLSANERAMMEMNDFARKAVEYELQAQGLEAEGHPDAAAQVRSDWESEKTRTKQKKMLYTAEQDAALLSLVRATGETYSDLIRRLIKAEAAQHGIEFPLNMQTRDETIKDAQKKRWPKDE